MSHSRDSIHQLTKITHNKLAGGLPTSLSASGNLKISIEESSAGGDASLAEQQTQTAHLAVIEGDTTSLDGKVVACNTGAVVISSSALPAGGATSALQTTGNSSLSSIDGKITACNTGSVVVSSSALPAGGATSALQTTGNSSLSNIEASHYADGDAISASDTGVLVMGRNGTNSAHPLHVTAQGDLEVEISEMPRGQTTMSLSLPVVIASDQSEISAHPVTVNNVGSQGNIINNASLANGATSSSVDVSNFNTAMVWVEDASTSSSDGYDLEVSEDNSSFYAMTSLYPSVRGGKREGVLYDLRLNGVKYIRLFNNSSTDTYTTDFLFLLYFF
jgi:hypothetical protein